MNRKPNHKTNSFRNGMRHSMCNIIVYKDRTPVVYHVSVCECVYVVRNVLFGKTNE